MQEFGLKKHLTAVLIMAALSILYYAPVVFGDKTLGPDALHTVWGCSGAWNDSLYSGMPDTRFLPPVPQCPPLIMFVMMTGCYVLLCVLRCTPWVALAGAAGYGLNTLFLTLLYNGLWETCWAVACMAPFLAGFVLCLRGRYPGGLGLISVSGLWHFFALQPQISYYLLWAAAGVALYFGIKARKEKDLRRFAGAVAVSLAAALVSFAPSAAGWLRAYNYNRQSVYGPCELQENTFTSGGPCLRMEECFTLLVPGFYGGSSTYRMPSESKTFRALYNTPYKEFAQNAPMYWGPQKIGNVPFSTGPVYAGAVFFFLFIFGLFTVRGSVKWFLAGAVAVSFILACSPLPKPFHYLHAALPLCLAMPAVTVLACLGLKTVFGAQGGTARIYLKDLYYAWGITALSALFFAFFGGSIYGFSSPADINLPDWLSAALRADRARLMTSTAVNSAFFISLAGCILLFVMRGRMKTSTAALLLAAVAALDLYNTSARYAGRYMFYPEKDNRCIPTQADLLIKQDTDVHYRVFNAAVNTFNESGTSRLHASIGGFHPMKLHRYHDLIAWHCSQGVTPQVLKMLNVRYFIKDQNGEPVVERNTAALGHGWFVDSIQWVGSPQEEIEALFDFNPTTTAVVDSQWKCRAEGVTESFAGDTVYLENYEPTRLQYRYRSNHARVLVFSEIYYPAWKVYIDGKEAPYFRADYVLRAMRVPAGEHTVEWVIR